MTPSGLMIHPPQRLDPIQAFFFARVRATPS